MSQCLVNEDALNKLVRLAHEMHEVIETFAGRLPEYQAQHYDPDDMIHIPRAEVEAALADCGALVYYNGVELPNISDDSPARNLLEAALEKAGVA